MWPETVPSPKESSTKSGRVEKLHNQESNVSTSLKILHESVCVAIDPWCLQDQILSFQFQYPWGQSCQPSLEFDVELLARLAGSVKAWQRILSKHQKSQRSIHEGKFPCQNRKCWWSKTSNGRSPPEMRMFHIAYRSSLLPLKWSLLTLTCQRPRRQSRNKHQIDQSCWCLHQPEDPPWKCLCGSRSMMFTRPAFVIPIPVSMRSKSCQPCLDKTVVVFSIRSDGSIEIVADVLLPSKYMLFPLF